MTSKTLGSGLDDAKTFDIEDGTDALGPWLDNSFDFASDLDLLWTGYIEQIVQHQSRRAFELRQAQRKRRIQRLAVAIEMADGVTPELPGAFDFYRFGECAETALAE